MKLCLIYDIMTQLTRCQYSTIDEVITASKSITVPIITFLNTTLQTQKTAVKAMISEFIDVCFVTGEIRTPIYTYQNDSHCLLFYIDFMNFPEDNKKILLDKLVKISCFIYYDMPTTRYMIDNKSVYAITRDIVTNSIDLLQPYAVTNIPMCVMIDEVNTRPPVNTKEFFINPVTNTQEFTTTPFASIRGAVTLFDAVAGMNKLTCQNIAICIKDYGKRINAYHTSLKLIDEHNKRINRKTSIKQPLPELPTLPQTPIKTPILSPDEQFRIMIEKKFTAMILEKINGTCHDQTYLAFDQQFVTYLMKEMVTKENESKYDIISDILKSLISNKTFMNELIEISKRRAERFVQHMVCMIITCNMWYYCGNDYNVSAIALMIEYLKYVSPYLVDTYNISQTSTPSLYIRNFITVDFSKCIRELDQLDDDINPKYRVDLITLIKNILVLEQAVDEARMAKNKNHWKPTKISDTIVSKYGDVINALLNDIKQMVDPKIIKQYDRYDRTKSLFIGSIFPLIYDK